MSLSRTPSPGLGWCLPRAKGFREKSALWGGSVSSPPSLHTPSLTPRACHVSPDLRQPPDGPPSPSPAPCSLPHPPSASSAGPLALQMREETLQRGLQGPLWPSLAGSPSLSSRSHRPGGPLPPLRESPLAPAPPAPLPITPPGPPGPSPANVPQRCSPCPWPCPLGPCLSSRNHVVAFSRTPEQGGS